MHETGGDRMGREREGGGNGNSMAQEHWGGKELIHSGQGEHFLQESWTGNEREGRLLFPTGYTLLYSRIN